MELTRNSTSTWRQDWRDFCSASRMENRDLAPVSRWKNALGRLREWIQSDAAEDQVRVTDEPEEARKAGADSARSDQSWSTKVRQHDMHPHTPSTGEAPIPEEARRHHDDELGEQEEVRRDSLANGMAQGMLNTALGGNPDPDDRDYELGMHIEQVAVDGVDPDLEGNDLDELEALAGIEEVERLEDLAGLDDVEDEYTAPSRENRPDTHH